MLKDKNISINEKIAGVLLAIYFFMTFYEPFITISAMKYYIIVVAVAFVILFGFNISKTNIAFMLIPWFAYRCITLIWSRNTEIVPNYFLGVLLLVIFTFIISNKQLNKLTIDFQINAILIGSFSIGVLSLFFHKAYLGNEIRQTLYLFGNTTDPNNQAAFLVSGIAISLYKLFQKKEKLILKLLFCLVVLINSFSMFLTGSRGGLITIVGLLIFFFFYAVKGIKKKIIVLFFICVLVGLALLLINKYLPSNIYERLFEFSDYEGGSERTSIWLNNISLLNTNPVYYIFGAGWGAYWGYNGKYAVLHNTFLAMLSDCGIVGIILFFYPIVKSFIYLSKNKNMLPLLLVVSAFIPCFFLEALNKRIFWTPIMILFLYYTYYKNVSRNIQGGELNEKK